MGHLTGELFKVETKTQFTHVPYKGSGPTMVAIVSGEVQASISSLVPAVPHIKSGKMRPLAVTTAKRARVLPDVPTVGESVPGFEVTHWYAIWGPKALPKEIVARWNQEVGRIIRTEAVQKFLEREGMEPAGGPPEEFLNRVKADVEKWKAVVKRAKISVTN
jgi:tripartite-type tricarboxylate transporter receptor subunit TctC